MIVTIRVLSKRKTSFLTAYTPVKLMQASWVFTVCCVYSVSVWVCVSSLSQKPHAVFKRIVILPRSRPSVSVAPTSRQPEEGVCSVCVCVTRSDSQLRQVSSSKLTNVVQNATAAGTEPCQNPTQQPLYYCTHGGSARKAPPCGKTGVSNRVEVNLARQL